jgi:hypothetical protein
VTFVQYHSKDLLAKPLPALVELLGRACDISIQVLVDYVKVAQTTAKESKVSLPSGLSLQKLTESLRAHIDAHPEEAARYRPVAMPLVHVQRRLEQAPTLLVAK